MVSASLYSTGSSMVRIFSREASSVDSMEYKLVVLPEPIGPVTPTITEFEQVVREFKLTPDQYLRSTRLREWARRNKNSKYIPEPLLEAWGFEIESTL